MLPDRVSNPGPLIYESDALPIALRGPASFFESRNYIQNEKHGPYFEVSAIKASSVTLT